MLPFPLINLLVFMIVIPIGIKSSFVVGKDDKKILSYFGFNEFPIEKSFRPDSLTFMQSNNSINVDTMNAKCGYSLSSSNGSLHWTQKMPEQKSTISQNGLTIAFWLYVNKITNIKTTILAVNDLKNNSFNSNIRWDTGTLLWDENFAHKQILSVSAAPAVLPTDSWNHVAFVHNFETGKVEIYLNSSKILVEFANNSIPTDFSISMLDGIFCPKFQFYGNIDEFYIIKAYLTSMEINDLMEYCTNGPPNFPVAMHNQYDYMKDEKNLKKSTLHNAVKRHLYVNKNYSLLCDATILEHTPFHAIKSATNILNSFSMTSLDECINNCCILDDCQMSHFNGTICVLIDCTIPSLCQPSSFTDYSNNEEISTLVYTIKQGESVLFLHNTTTNKDSGVTPKSDQIKMHYDTNFCNDRSTIRGKAGIEVNGRYKEIQAQKIESEKQCNETCCSEKQCYLYVYEPQSKFCMLYLCTGKSGCDVEFQNENNVYTFLSKNNSIQFSLPTNNQSHISQIQWNYVKNDTNNDESPPAHENWIKTPNSVSESTKQPIDNLFNNYSLLLENLKQDFGKYKDETLTMNKKAESNSDLLAHINYKNYGNSFELVATTIWPIIKENFECETDYIFENVDLPDTTVAVLLIHHPTNNVESINECGLLCCNNQVCDIGYLKERKCYLLSCTNKKLCYFTTRSKSGNKGDRKQAIAYVKRNGISLFENLLKNEQSTKIKTKSQSKEDVDLSIKFNRKSNNGVCLYSYPIQAILNMRDVPVSFFSIELSTNLDNCQDYCCKKIGCFSAYQNEGYCFLFVCKIRDKHQCFKYTRPPYLHADSTSNSLLVYVKRRKIKLSKNHYHVNTSEIDKDFTHPTPAIHIPSTTPSPVSQNEFTFIPVTVKGYDVPSYYGNNYQYTPLALGFPWKPFQNFYASELASKKSWADNEYPKQNYDQLPASYEQPPKIKDIRPSKIVLEQHLSVTFHCETEGFPTPKISWSQLKEINPSKHNNNYVDNLEPLKSDDRITILDAGYLIIDNIHPSDSAIYVCIAINSYGSAYSEATLEVLDVNECNSTSGVSLCKHTCINTIGSYFCRCFDGYKLSSVDNSTCSDIDECQSKQTNDCNQLCINTEGSYSCQCLSGYQMSKNNVCKDINECLVMKNPCGNGVCKNNIGSFSCECESIDDYFSKETNECVRNISKLFSTDTSNYSTIFKRSFDNNSKLYITGLIASVLLLILIILLVIVCIKYRYCKSTNKKHKS